MFLENILNSVKKNYRKIPINGISFDSREVKKQHIFFAIAGNQVSGDNFINEAISKGASVIVCSKKTECKKKIPIILVNDVRKSLSEACSNFYKKKKVKIIAVTGTNGKSSVADFFYQILKINKIPVASIGTLGIFSKNYNKKTNLTSLDPLTLHKSLQILTKKNVKNIILEASSHGLEQKRLDYVNISTGIFTNFSHDHLDYHKNMKSYFNSKMHLFKNLLKKNSNIIVDEDIKEFKSINKIAKLKKFKKKTIGVKSGDIRILYNKYNQNDQVIKLLTDKKIYKLKVPLIGFFQIKNLLMAVHAASLCGLNKSKIFKQLNKIKPVSGRLEPIANLKNSSNIIIDFAHTPEALEKSLETLKKQFKKEIILVFGCGGNRDIKKRFIMGKIASKYCKKVFVTDDNPRKENPKNIRDSIIKGCKNIATNIGNRKKAIKTAINELSSNQILLVAGKGHEETQDFGSKVINFSDKKIIKKIIKKNFFLSSNNLKDFILNKALNKKNLKNINYDGVSINTKNIKKNNLFFAIKGKKIDGHDFSKEAIKKGAIKLITSKKIKHIGKNKYIKVKNTLLCLNSLAKITRAYSSATIVGITGSVGKTTLKNLISFSLKNYGKTYHSPYSYNNKFGVPLSVSNLKKDTNYGVFEIGMDKKGEIDALSKIVKPDLGIINNISPAHFKNFNTLKDIAKAKSEIINNIVRGGDIILNKDSNFFNFLFNKAKKNGLNIISFSHKKKSDVSLLGYKKIKKKYKLKIKVKNKIFYFNTKYITESFISNILACISVLYVLNLNLKKMEKKFINFTIPEGRGDLHLIKRYNKKFKLIDESYNANPLSMFSAIKNMSFYKINKRNKKLAFLGDMLELGKKSKKYHRDLSGIINKSDINKAFVYGKYIKETFNYLHSSKKGKVFNSLKEANNHFNKILNNNDLLMIKGSNATGLNNFAKSLKKGQTIVI